MLENIVKDNITLDINFIIIMFLETFQLWSHQLK